MPKTLTRSQAHQEARDRVLIAHDAWFALEEVKQIANHAIYYGAAGTHSDRYKAAKKADRAAFNAYLKLIEARAALFQVADAEGVEP